MRKRKVKCYLPSHTAGTIEDRKKYHVPVVVLWGNRTSEHLNVKRTCATATTCSEEKTVVAEVTISLRNLDENSTHVSY